MSIPRLSDKALDDHINELETELSRLHISLELATAERNRRVSRDNKDRSITSIQKGRLTVGSQVRILNKYRGNKGKEGTITQIAGKTATVHIPSEGHFVKYLRNLELLPSHDEK